ncbi:MAG: phosphodiester glycosidase family protein, partial [Pseudomonadota bacterium]|nr:phosphodiester glycosidase family protein [Pseudomonadota bacterium]
VVISGGPGTSADFLARHLHPGDRVSFVLAVAPVGETERAVQIAALPRSGRDLPSRSGASISRSAWLWAQVPQAVGGGPHLLVNGQVAVDWAAEGFEAGFADSLNPRTAVGTTRDGHHLLLVTVDGRQAFSKGVSLTDIALILKRYGAWNAINLDGGGSTAMAVGGVTVSNPQGGGSERPVADMLLVYSDHAFQPDAPALPAVTADAEAAQEDPAVHLVVPLTPIAMGHAVPLKVQDGAREVSGTSPAIIWQGPATGGVGFVNQKGYFITATPGKGVLSALYKGQLLTAPVTVIGARPVPAAYTVQAHLAADPGDLQDRNQLIIRITNRAGKPLAAAPVTLQVTGGTADKDTLQTDFDGSATVGITWTADKGGSVRASSGALTPVTITRP